MIKPGTNLQLLNDPNDQSVWVQKSRFLRQRQNPECLTHVSYSLPISSRKYTIYLCRAFVVDNKCEEKFFGSDDKEHIVREAVTRVASCKGAATKHIRPHGCNLLRASTTLYHMRLVNTFDCRWEQTTVTRGYEYEVQSFFAIVVAVSGILHQR